VADYGANLIQFAPGDGKQVYTVDGAEFDVLSSGADLEEFATPDGLTAYDAMGEFDMAGSDANRETLGADAGYRPDIRDEPMLPRRAP
jgi:hypothetical protein